MLFYVLVVFLCFNKLFMCQQSNGTLRSVVAITRHGERTLHASYPNDPYKNISFWPGGFAQLTNKGKSRLYNLGRWFRERYNRFIPETYSLYDCYVRSTDVDRTLMSAEAFLAGFYPPKYDQAWNPVLQWQPIPIHTVPKDEDSLLAESKPCPMYNQLLDNLYKTDLAPIQEKLSSLYSYTTLHTGKSISTLEDIQNLFDTFCVEEDSMYKLPSWVEQVYPEPLKTWAIYGSQIYTYKPDMAKLAVGPILDAILGNFLNNSRHEDGSYQRFKLYSGHETTINNVMTALDVHNNLLIPYGAALIFEYHKDDDLSFVNILYKNSTEHGPYEIVLKDCQFNCSLTDFMDIVAPLTVDVDDWDDQCKIPDNSTEVRDNNSSHKTSSTFVTCLISIIALYELNYV